MSNHSDRLFHQVIAGTALLLALGAGLPLVNQHQLPSMLRHYLGLDEANHQTTGWEQKPPRKLLPASHLTSSAKRAARGGASTKTPAGTVPTGLTQPGDTAGSAGSTGGGAQSAAVSPNVTGLPRHANPAAGKAALRTGSQPESGLVDVSAYDSTVAETAVNHVNFLLQQYHVMQTATQVTGLTPAQPVHVYLVQNAAHYQSALRDFGISTGEAANLTADTGGFTEGNRVVIALYQSSTDADLVNTLGHELTHALLNENADQIPSWLNEGLAVYVGMRVQKLTEAPLVYDGYVRRMSENVLEAAASGQLLPLMTDESQVLATTASYDVELQDWLAIKLLVMSPRSESDLRAYLEKLRHGSNQSMAFQSAFSESESHFGHAFDSLLNSAAHAHDSGVELTFLIPRGFHGRLQILQHGTQWWRGFVVHQGNVTVLVTAHGTLSGKLGHVLSTEDPEPADDETLYVNLDPSRPFTYHGKQVQDSGFALDYHFGMYSFVDAWITTTDGNSTYLSAPSLFKIRLAAATERGTGGSLARLLNRSAV